MLRRYGITSTAGCNCDQRALLMDVQGPEWCLQNIDTIIGWMKEEAEKRGMVFVECAAKFVVLMAIRNAKYKLRVMR